MSKLTYSADTEPGQGMTFPDCKIVKGFNGMVKKGPNILTRSGLFGSQTQAMRWATAKASEYRAYRQKHGEGIEDRQHREAMTKRAEGRRNSRRNQKAREIYDLLQALAADAELVKEWLPSQAIARLDKVRELVAFVENDPPTG